MVITAANTTSVIPLIASIQPIQERKGLIWFKNVVSRTDRGNVNNGDTLLDAKQGRQKIAEEFAGEHIRNEQDATGDGKAKDFAFVVKYPEVRLRTLEITVEGQPNTQLLDDGKGNIIGVGGKGSIKYSTGEVQVSFDDAPDDGAAILSSYDTNLETLAELQTVNTEFVSTSIEAKTYALRTEVGFDSHIKIA